MRIVVAKEAREGERRVALVPESVSQLVQAGHEVWMEVAAGVEASYPDTAYEAAGATVMTSDALAWRDVDIFLKVSAPIERRGKSEIERLRPGAVLIGFLNPMGNVSIVPAIPATHLVTPLSISTE